MPNWCILDLGLGESIKYSRMDIHEAQQHFKGLLDRVDKSQLPGFFRWIKENIGRAGCWVVGGSIIPRIIYYRVGC